MNELIDKIGDFLAEKPGLLPLVGVLLVVVNFILQIFPGPGSGWFVDSNLLLHLGIVVALIGLLLVRPLSG
ncbi:MAG: hypothetical protein D6835_05835 [Candidatus Thermofonsia bacterium]|nr:MAG: hypothetical protein D6835_05835 [Candidatus Thermofonsia bacterium]